MLSRLISLLRRIPAVKWAFTRLRPLPHGSSVDDAPIAASCLPTSVTDLATASATDDSVEPAHHDAETVAAAVAEDNVAVSVVAEDPAAAPDDIGVDGDSGFDAPAEVEPAIAEQVPVSSVEIEPVDAPELVNDQPPAELLTNVEPVAEEAPVSSIQTESEPVEIPEPVTSSDPAPELTAVEPILAQQSPISSVEIASIDVSSVEVEIAPAVAPALIADDEPCSGAVAEVEPDTVMDSTVAAGIEPIPANDPAPVAVAAAETAPADAPGVVTNVPELVVEAVAPKLPAAPKPRAKIVEPTDRAALIRQRWAETGIRMWNPRLHGTGDATLNIQGSVGLLPPAQGETMPRYDKLEFKMLGGQIVCEGVIVEAPASAGHRSFTRLAGPEKPDRIREPVRERQAALA